MSDKIIIRCDFTITQSKSHREINWNATTDIEKEDLKRIDWASLFRNFLYHVRESLSKDEYFPGRTREELKSDSLTVITDQESLDYIEDCIGTGLQPKPNFQVQ